MKYSGFNHVSSLSLAAFASICGLAWAVIATPVPAAAQGTPEQQQACQPDAFRLCGDFIPDVDSVTKCMVKKKASLSPACKAVFSKPVTRKRKPTHR